MSINVGTAVAYLTLNKSGFQSGLKSAGMELKNFTDKSQNISTRVDSLGKSMTNVGSSLTKKVTLPVAGAAVAMGKSAMDFEDSMAKVSTIADTKAVSLKNLGSQIMKLSDNTGIASTEIANNVYDAISAGQKTGDAVNFVSNSTKLAKAGFAEAGQSLDLLTTILNSYGMKASEVGKVSDILIQTQNVGKVTVGELSESMGKVIPTANSMGIKLEQVASGYAIMTAKGIKAAETTTYMNSMFNEMGKNGTKASDAIKAATGKTFQQLIASGKSVGDILAIMDQSAKKAGLSLNDMFGSSEAGKAAIILSNNAGKDFNKTLKDMGNVAGATDEAFKKVNNTASQKLKVSLNQLKNTGIQLGAQILPVVNTFASMLVKLLNLFSKLPGPVKTALMQIALSAAIVGPVLVALGKLVSGVSTVIGIFSKLKTAASVFTALPTIINPPVLIAIAVIAGIGLIVYQVIKHWNVLKKAATSLGTHISSKFKAISNTFSQSIRGWKMLFSSMGKYFSSVGSNIVNGLTGGIKRGLGKLKDTMSHMASSVKGTFAKLLGIHSPSRVFMGYGDNIGQGLVNGLSNQDSKISNKFKNLAGKIKGLGNISPEFKNLNNLTLSGGFNSASGSTRGNSSRSVNFTPQITMHINVSDTGAKGTKELTQELKGMAKTALKDSMVDLFMGDVIKSF